MTSNCKSGALFAFFLILLPLASTAQNFSSAGELLTANLEAEGGASGWGSVRTVHTSSEIVMESQMGALVMTMESWVIKGSHMYTFIKMINPPPGIPPGATENKMYVTPDGGWIDGMQGRQNLDQIPAQQRELLMQGLFVNRTLALLELPDSLISLLSDVEFDGTQSHVMQVSGDALSNMFDASSKYFFDAESLLLVGTEMTMQFGTVVSKMSDYREIDGVLMSFSQRVEMGQMGTQNITVKEIEINAPITPESLEKMAGQ